MTPAAREVFDGLFPGESAIRALMRTLDWANTSMGPVEHWPQSLKTAFGMCLASRFPFIIWWGEDLSVIYNDAYIPIFGGKHPGAFGSPGLSKHAWGDPEVKAAIEPMLRGVMSGAEATWSEDQLLILERSGFPEETYFTWSYSPIPAEGGRVGGILTTVTEVTQKVLSERRLSVLRELSARASEARTAEEACSEAMRVLAQAPNDVPFALAYLLDESGETATLAQSLGLGEGHPAAPAALSLGAPDALWPLARARTDSVDVELAVHEPRLGKLSGGPWPEPVTRARVQPLLRAGETRPHGFLITGLSPRLPLSDGYRDFLKLVAGHLATAISNARTYEQERRRAEALAELDRAKTAFFSNVSHEFRTPLTLMLGPVEDSLGDGEQPLPPRQRERLEAVHRNALRLLKLVNTLLDFSRIEAGRTQASFEPVELSGLTADLASAFRSLIEKAGLQLRVDCPPLPEPVWVDLELWEKVVLNLLSNAFKFTLEGAIEVSVRAHEGRAVVSVRDTGTGIPAGELPRLFERFHRVQGTHGRSFEGTGIGLALVQELVRLHGGSVRVESTVGKGSCFEISIPFGHTHLPADRLRAGRADSSAQATRAALEEASGWVLGAKGLSPPPEARVDPPNAAARRRARIVLADDNADMRSYVRRLLEEQYEVEAVADGHQALAAIERRPPELVLTDVMMPGLDGFGLLRALRKNPRTQTVPLIMLSARAGEEARVEGMEAGADDYLVKPFAARELMARVSARLEIAQLHRQLNTELERRVKERTAQLTAANQELESFSYSVSHDLRAPLRHIVGFAQLLEKSLSDKLDGKSKEQLERIRGAGLRGGQLVDDLLAFCRLGRAEVQKKPVALSALVDEVRLELQPESEGREVVWKVAPLPVVAGDAPLLRLVLKNLLGNALKYTRPKSEAVIELSARESADDVTVSVKDNGVGFDMAHAEQLFGVFQRLHSSDEFEGTGIGLALARRIIGRHGGTISARAQPDRGAEFEFTLPRAP